MPENCWELQGGKIGIWPGNMSKRTWIGCGQRHEPWTCQYAHIWQRIPVTLIVKSDSGQREATKIGDGIKLNTFSEMFSRSGD